MYLKLSCYFVRMSVVGLIVMAAVLSPADAESGSNLPANFIEQIVKDKQTMHLTLPNGQRVVGKIKEIQRGEKGVQQVSGIIQHPEAGTFSFKNNASKELEGNVSFDAKPTEWKVQSAGEAGGFRLVEAPVADAFRPRKMEMPTAEKAQAASGVLRKKAEASLRKDLNIEKISEHKLKIGKVILDKQDRSIQFPATVNMIDKTIEYAVVADSGKCHESLFITSALPRDVHLAMLLLGVKPAKCAASQDGGLLVPENAALTVSVKWQQNGVTHTHSLYELFNIGQSASEMRKAKTQNPMWLYNGSLFNDAGFAAQVEGSIISLIADDTALMNNPRKDRNDDAVHIPNTSLLPTTDTPVTLIISQYQP